MTISFNLIDKEWIPCLTLDGQYIPLSIYDVLVNAQHIEKIVADTPIMSISVLPPLLAILHRVFGPEDARAWRDLYQNGSFPKEALEDYFRKWYDHFDLFHPERPFYQMADPRVKRKSVIHLIHSIGNTGTLFTHVNEAQGVYLSPAEAALHLLTAQLFRTAGLSGLDEKFTDATFTRGVLFWAQGNTLFETLMLNLMPYPATGYIMPQTDDDKPVWERVNAFIPQRETPLGYLDYLTWQSNKILFFPIETQNGIFVREMTIAPAMRIGIEVKSPQKRYEKKSKPPTKPDESPFSFMYFSESKALWRNYHTLLTLDSQEDIRPPKVVEWLAELATTYEYLDKNKSYQLMAGGMLADQAKPIFYRQELMPLPYELISQQYDLQFVTSAIEKAEAVCEDLKKVFKTLATHVLARGETHKPHSDDIKNLVEQWDAISLYWQSLERHFWDFINLLVINPEEAHQKWLVVLQTEAFSALDKASQLAGKGVGGLKGTVLASQQLGNYLKKTLNS